MAGCRVPSVVLDGVGIYTLRKQAQTTASLSRAQLLTTPAQGLCCLWLCSIGNRCNDSYFYFFLNFLSIPIKQPTCSNLTGWFVRFVRVSLPLYNHTQCKSLRTRALLFSKLAPAALGASSSSSPSSSPSSSSSPFSPGVLVKRLRSLQHLRGASRRGQPIALH